MTVKYDVDKLKEIIDSICTLTGLSMCVMDTEFNPLYTKEKKEDAFCHRIQKTSEGADKCRCSDIKMIQECAKAKAPISHICHAGLIDTVVPIIKNGITAGFIIIGRVRPAKALRSGIGICGIAPEQLKRNYKKLTYLSESQLSSLIGLLSHILFENAIHIEYNDLISRATDYIENNLEKPLCIDELCKALYVSKNQLYSSFHSFYGCTVREYIIRQKIQTAQKMLCDTNESAAAVAKAVGFDNYTYFCKLFKKVTGKTPSEQRAKMAEVRK